MKLQFTNGYRPRFDQISRILQYLMAQEERTKVPRSEIVTKLGIPDKQIENLTSMMTGFGLVPRNSTHLTPFAKAVIKADPYFEKIDTLWIIHYIVSSNPEWIVWYRIINLVLPNQDYFEVDKVSSQYFADLAGNYSSQAITKKLPKEVGAVFAAYSRTELANLEILKAETRNRFIKTNPITIYDVAFLYCIIHYRDNHNPGASAVNIEHICRAEFSPGKVLNLPEFQVRSILNNLHDSGLIRLEQFGNLDQIRLSDTITQGSTLDLIYGAEDAA